MQGRVVVSLIFCLMALTVVSAGRAEMMQFTPDRDNTLYEDIEGDVSNGSGSYIFMGRIGINADPPSQLRRALVHFNVSGIPAEAVVDSVEVRFEIVGVPPSQDATGGTATLHRVLAEWGEGDSNAPGVEGQGTLAVTPDATWQHRMYDSDFWDVAGGDFVMQASAGSGYGITLETLIFASTPDLVRDVTHWVKNPGQNFGWILVGNEGLDHTARRIDARERLGGMPALLTVEYHIPNPTDTLAPQLIASGLSQPVAIANAGDGSNRLFIVERAGRIRIVDLDTGTLLPTPFLDITSLVDSTGSEQGLLGLAFHPDYENNRQFYVNYTYDPPGSNPDRTRIAMYRASIGNPDVANTMETDVLGFEQNASNHNGGDMHFDPSGYLVISSGDGGGAGDQYHNAQNVDTLKGAMLRIDVDGSPAMDAELCGLTQNYGIPPGNAFPGSDDGCDEILHYGLRNPWRFSFDARTGEMYIGDVGQGDWEEVDHAAVAESGLNFGWPCFEGTHEYDNMAVCPEPVDPVIEYSSGPGSGNQAVTGGYVYRGGNSILAGRYVYADYASARIWIATPEGESWTSEEWIESPPLSSISAFGEDQRCELYVADYFAGNVYRIIDTENLDSSGFESLHCQ